MILVSLSVCLSGGISASELSIYSMVVGKKALELQENRQLTFGSSNIIDAKISPDGKSVVFLTQENKKVNLCLVKSVGGKVTTVMSGTDVSNWPDVTKSESGKGWCIAGPVVWSSDSRILALFGRYVAREEDKKTSTRDHILVLASSGEHVASLPFPQFVEFRDNLVFSPDSNSLAAKYYNPLEDPTDGIMVFNLDGSSKVAYKSKDYFELLGWDNQEFLLIKEGLGEAAPLVRIWLDGREPEKIENAHRWLSPDGQLCVLPELPEVEDLTSIVVKNIKEDKMWVVAKNKPPYAFREWLPNSRMITYFQSNDVIDQTQDRKEVLNSIWLASVISTKLNTMCVAMNHDTLLGVKPSWSSDCMRMAYVYRERLYVAELGWREPTAYEKLAVGLKLTEEEEKQLLQNNGKEIAVALQLYWNDYDGKLPNPDTVLEDLKSHMKSKDLYFRPGTEEVIFKYIDPGVERESEIQADTVIGILDPGDYDWVVKIYADTHVKIVPKE